MLLVEFDQELVEQRKAKGEVSEKRSAAIALLVDHTHSIPVRHDHRFFSPNEALSHPLAGR